MACFPDPLRKALDSPGQTLKIECSSCGHRAEFAQRLAFRLFGANADPMEIRRRARCGVCGAGNPDRVWV